MVKGEHRPCFLLMFGNYVASGCKFPHGRSTACGVLFLRFSIHLSYTKIKSSLLSAWFHMNTTVQLQLNDFPNEVWSNQCSGIHKKIFHDVYIP